MEKTRYPHNPILIVDDEPHILAGFHIALSTRGINNIIRCQDSRQVEGLLQNEDIEMILLDLTMPHVSGQEILARVSEEQPDIPVVVVTGVNEVDTAVSCMQHGAFDYVLKPVDIDRLLPSVRRALEIRRLRRENSLLADRFLADDLANPDAFAPIVSGNHRMKAIFQYCEAIAPGRQPVLITGETGSGKELIARAIHEAGSRSGSFVAVNVAGLDDTVFSDTLFGHARGAYTGAESARSGLVEKAAGGTLFLDEVGDLSEASQVKLLRFLEDRSYLPLGSDTPKISDARVLAATHTDLARLQREKRFRSDLFYRFKTHSIRIPPLRERRDDIGLLLDHFLELAAREFNKKTPTYHPELITLLKGYHFPGNVRELKAMVFDAVSSHTTRMLSSQGFKEAMAGGPGTPTPDRDTGRESGQHWLSGLDPLPTLKEASDALITEALRRTGHNQRVAATLLGISPQALSQRLKRS